MEINGKYYLADYESGHTFEVTKEVHDRCLAAMKKVFDDIQKAHPDFKGKVIITGTAGDMEANERLNQIFLNPES